MMPTPRRHATRRRRRILRRLVASIRAAGGNVPRRYPGEPLDDYTARLRDLARTDA